MPNAMLEWVHGYGHEVVWQAASWTPRDNHMYVHLNNHVEFCDV